MRSADAEFYYYEGLGRQSEYAGRGGRVQVLSARQNLAVYEMLRYGRLPQLMQTAEVTLWLGIFKALET